ncbi:MAG: Maf family protein [Solirubrobacteraceae bacterium]
MASRPLILASGSPQRRAILERLGVTFTVRATDVEELSEGDPVEVARENALRKARAALRPGAAEAVLGCDTLVTLDGAIYGKPPDESAARATLMALGGRTHEVISGIALLLADGGPGVTERMAVARTRVTFGPIDEGLLGWYLSTGEWRGRSGGYAIQGAGEKLAQKIDGEVENVVGLPVVTLRDMYPELFRH